MQFLPTRRKYDISTKCTEFPNGCKLCTHYLAFYSHIFDSAYTSFMILRSSTSPKVYLGELLHLNLKGVQISFNVRLILCRFCPIRWSQQKEFRYRTTKKEFFLKTGIFFYAEAESYLPQDLLWRPVEWPRNEPGQSRGTFSTWSPGWPGPRTSPDPSWRTEWGGVGGVGDGASCCSPGRLS